MSKTSQCIKLLRILYSRKQPVNITELAGELETNPRNILEYIRELRNCGYQIKTVKGRYGGYLLEKNDIGPLIKIIDMK